MPDYRRRQRRDRIGAWLARSVAMLVLLVVVLLIGYLLVAVIPLGWPEQPETHNSYAAEPGDSALLAFSPDHNRITRIKNDGRALRFAPQSGLLYQQTMLGERFALDTGNGFMARQLIGEDQREYLLVVNANGLAGLWQWRADELSAPDGWPALFRLSDNGNTNLLSARIQAGQLLLAVQIQTEQAISIRAFTLIMNSPQAAQSGDELAPSYVWSTVLSFKQLQILDQQHLLAIRPGAGEASGLFSLEPGSEADQGIAQRISLPEPIGNPAGMQLLQPDRLLLSSDDGRLHQLVLDTGGSASAQLADSYDCGDSPPVRLIVSRDNRWFGCIGAQGRARLFSSGRQAPVWTSNPDSSVSDLALTAEYMLVDDGSSLQYLVRDAQPVPDNRLLWQRVWYAGYDEPEFVWQPLSTAPGGPKYSVTPLLFGTIKAATLALLFGVPFALLGAIYVSLILAREWRERLKPVVEMLEAMPTVIIGFLAAVWLAPYLQNHLLICLLLFCGLPLALVLLGYGWSRFLSRKVNTDWHWWLPLVLIAVLVLALAGIGWLLEWWWFDGQLSAWLEKRWGWTYDLRNSLVVGVALGLAVTPTIFALCEDALTAVPKPLRLGAVALGATRWQAVWQVIVPYAASGLLAAILIGLGRALGETMIVLMAASNTPLIEASPLRGLQAIAPTLAIEMPEADPGGLHFRVLLLCALVLFVITLLANTLAEFIRSRLRRRYQL